MMATDEERREAAKRLRGGSLAEGIGDDGIVDSPDEAGILMLRVLDVINDYRVGMHYLPSHFSAEAAVGLLADLIEPQERTCRAVGEDPLGFRSCSSCGYETWADDDSVTPYCPNCEARVIE